MSGKAGKTTLTKILAYLRDFFAEAAKTVFSINNRLPDANGNVDLQVVPGAQQLVTDEAQESDAVFDIRTTGGDASIGDGTAVLMQIRGNAVHTGAVQEVIRMTLTLATREEGVDPITAALDEDVFRGAVSESGTTTLLYTAAWSEDPAGYGVTVTGTPMAGDIIAIEYVKGDRGTIRVATPSAFRSTGYNLYDHSKGYAFVKKYSASYGFLIAGDYAAVQFSETEDGARTPITPAGGYFNVPGDGYVWVTGGNGTNTEIYMTWSDWVGGRDCAWKAYEEDEIDLSGIIGDGKFFPWGMARVGSVYDEIDTNSSLAISRIERMPYSDENMAAVIAAGRGYDADTDYIYAVRETPVQADVAIDGAYAANDHGMELFDDTDVPVGILVLYGENLVDKLRRDVVTKSQDIVNGFTSTATDKALSAAAGKTLNDNISFETIASGDLNNLVASGGKIKHYCGSNINSFSNVPSGLSNYAFSLDVYQIGTDSTYTKQVLHFYGSIPTTYERQQYWATNSVQWCEWKELTRGSFSTYGTTGSGTTMNILLPVGAMFDGNHPIFVILSYRSNTAVSAEGYCVLKLQETTVYVVQKTGMSNATDFAYNSTTRILSFTTSSYMSCVVMGGTW